MLYTWRGRRELLWTQAMPPTSCTEICDQVRVTLPLPQGIREEWIRPDILKLSFSRGLRRRAKQIEPDSSCWPFYIQFFNFYIYKLKCFPFKSKRKASEGSKNHSSSLVVKSIWALEWGKTSFESMQLTYL